MRLGWIFVGCALTLSRTRVNPSVTWGSNEHCLGLYHHLNHLQQENSAVVLHPIWSVKLI
ncbi:unnamed protein product [Blumeria hordei]|uniref:Uncharacterized protein n=1 Tax=Blumeria hordei TaxID=2867405 RepID=A0A383V093_BLUHO|nr:unnamed protein product [Blumeria hordei]